MDRQTYIGLVLTACDHEIRPVVEDLLRNNIETIASCQGGPGHSFSGPTVRIAARHTRQKINRILQKEGYRCYHISGCWGPQSGGTMTLRYWEVEFWDSMGNERKNVALAAQTGPQQWMCL